MTRQEIEAAGFRFDMNDDGIDFFEKTLQDGRYAVIVGDMKEIAVFDSEEAFFDGRIVPMVLNISDLHKLK
jgi:hypothetical protein